MVKEENTIVLATEERLSTATAVLRGLIFQLVRQYPKLVSYVRKPFDEGNKQVFEDNNAWYVLCRIMESILQDEDLGEVLMIVDALDECKDTHDLERLVKFISKISAYPRVKMLVSSRHRWEIQTLLGREEEHAITLSLELHENSISVAVTEYIEEKMKSLARETLFHENPDLLEKVRDNLIENSDNTFLWVALVCQDLARSTVTRRGHVERILRKSPPGLDRLYRRMVRKISSSRDAMICLKVLAATSVAKRPMKVSELFHAISDPLDKTLGPEDMKGVIESCGSFLNIQKATVYFVHQSAVDFLSSGRSKLPNSAERHRDVLQNSLESLLTSKQIKRDIYGIEALGTAYGNIELPEPDPMSALQYSCTYWVDHLVDWISERNQVSMPVPSMDTAIMRRVQDFLETRLLYWIEYLALHGQVRQALRSIQRLHKLVSLSLLSKL
ncbi:hypothetical protein CSPX01_06270 [Colletotrichum filicis]|nr:hypothetical protein CSPX01_06270 [Colletotrichum filicis]